MKKLFLLFSLLFFPLFSNLLYAQVIWEENFDGFSQDWVCCLANCANNPGVPPGFIEFHSNTLGKNYGMCNSQITTNAERKNPSGTNKRGFRIYLEEDSWPTGENTLVKDLGGNYTLIYLRWYQRDSANDYSNCQKLFRIYDGETQILIPEWQKNWQAKYRVQMNLGTLGAPAANNFFTGYNFDTDYTVNTWMCYEIKIDLINKESQFWVNGISKGILTSLPIPDGWEINKIKVGGNQYGHSWVNPIEHTIDYDDIVVSTSYVGPDKNDPPNPPKGLRIE